LILATPFAYKSAIVGNYFLNLDYYANELCENKNSPEKNCNGVCQLSKELSNDSNQENPSCPTELREIDISSFILPVLMKFRGWYLCNNDSASSNDSVPILVGFPLGMIKPPCC
jgi:hypothetical protein